MKKSFTGFLIAVTINISAVIACAADPPVSMTHDLTGYEKGPKSITLEYSLHLVNTGETPIGDLSLSLVPRLPFVTTSTSFDIGYLAPEQSADVTVKMVTPLSLDREQFSKRALYWAGECLDAEGKLVEFPLKSRPGGAK